MNELNELNYNEQGIGETWTVGDTTYTTRPSLRFATIDPHGGFGSVTVELEPGETQTVTICGKPITVHRAFVRD